VRASSDNPWRHVVRRVHNWLLSIALGARMSEKVRNEDGRSMRASKTCTHLLASNAFREKLHNNLKSSVLSVSTELALYMLYVVLSCVRKMLSFCLLAPKANQEDLSGHARAAPDSLGHRALTSNFSMRDLCWTPSRVVGA